MSAHHFIRPEFICLYLEKYSHRVKLSSRSIAKRDVRIQLLNEKFGLCERNGTFSTNQKSTTNARYNREYDYIIKEFKSEYNQLIPDFNEWCHNNKISIFEYLLFDNIREEHLKVLCIEAQKDSPWALRPIQRKARLFVDELKIDHTVGEMRDRIVMECNQQSYANARCRGFFSIKPWDVHAHKAIYDYGCEWKQSLQRSLDSSVVS